MTDTPAPLSPEARPKKSLARRMVRWAIELLIVIVIGIVVLYLARNSLIRAGVMRGGSVATGQSVTLDSADLAVLGGNLDLDSLAIANLKDFKQPNILTVKKCQVVHLAPASLLTHTVQIDTIAISGLELTLEQNGTKNNLADLVEELKKNTASAGQPTNAPPGKELRIAKLQLAATKVHIRSDIVNMDLDLGPIELDDPTNPDGRLPKLADLIGKILIHISQQLVDDPRLPGALKANMKNVTALVDNLRGQLNKEVVGLKTLQKDLTTNPAKALKDAQNIGKDLQNLIPKKEPGK
jgi:uncharacterized protein involved in outer membrane biogenesis